METTGQHFLPWLSQLTLSADTAILSLESFYLPLALFVLSTAGTPGPNNVILTATGAQFGYKRTLPAVYGIILGMASQITLVSAGLGVLFQQWPALHQALKLAGAAYLIWLAWKIFNSRGMASADNKEQPITLIEAALFQYLNPKAWVMSLSMVSAFSVPGDHYWYSVINIVLVAFLVMHFTQHAWAGFGSAIGRFLTNDQARLRFNVVMATLTAASVWFVIR